VTESASQHPLSDRALSQLRKLADGNGLDPQKILLLKTDEKVYVLEGMINLKPDCDVKTARYPGKLRGKNCQILPAIEAIQSAVDQKRQESTNPELWLSKAIAELKAQPGEGWGLNEARITLPEASVTFAASGPCLHCHGQALIACIACQSQGMIQCNQCQGRGEELCYHCFGRGDDPNQPGQPCPQCRGSRYATCRFCVVKNYPRGYVPCPTCNGRRGLPCPECKGTGLFSEEAAVHMAVIARFRLKMGTGGVPSVFNRTLDRLGLVNLTKGHADIETYTPDEEEEAEIRQKAPTDGSVPAVFYRAKVPYAEMRLNIDGKLGTASIFGKRGMLVNLPPFLDEAIAVQRTHLSQAAKGQGSLDSAMTARCLREALALQAAGKGNFVDLKRIYPVGLSVDAAKEIMGNMRKALNRTTLHLRAGGAALFTVLAAGGFYGLFFTPLYGRCAAGLRWIVEMGIGIALPLAAMLLAWLLLGLAVRMVLSRRFPGIRFALWQKTGKTGFAMMGLILAVYAAFLALAPTRPVWIYHLIH
jgi:hypothetical protein